MPNTRLSGVSQANGVLGTLVSWLLWDPLWHWVTWEGRTACAASAIVVWLVEEGAHPVFPSLPGWYIRKKPHTTSHSRGKTDDLCLQKTQGRQVDLLPSTGTKRNNLLHFPGRYMVWCTMSSSSLSQIGIPGDFPYFVAWLYWERVLYSCT